MKKRIIFFLIIPILVGVFVYFGVWYWAMTPVFVPPQGLSRTGTESELVHNNYPMHLVNPERLSNQDQEYWPFYESRARLAVVSGFVFMVSVRLGFTGSRLKPVPLTRLLRAINISELAS